MKNMTHPSITQKCKTQAGNVFFAIFGAIAVVGLLGAGLSTFVSGPLSSSVTLTRESAAQNQMVIGAQTALMGAAAQASSGDCDLDGFIEPVPWRAAGGAPAPVGGGLIPNSIPAPKRDPWGTDYGYCVWDHGPTVDDAACGGPTQGRLSGTDSRGYPSLAMISAGPDRVFQTTCADFNIATPDDKLVYKVDGTDDLIFSYTYEEAVAATGDIWVLKSSDPDTAVLNKKVEVGGGISFSGLGDFIGITADSFSSGAADFINLPGIRIPDSSSYGAACTPALAGVLRTNMSSVSPPAVVSSATDAQGFRDADSASVTFHSRPIAGNTVIVTVRGYAAGGFNLTAAGVTDSDGNTYVDVGSTGDATAPARVMMFAAYNISGADNQLTVTINPVGGTASGVIGALEISGIDAGSLDITGNSTAGNGTVSASGTTAAANSLAIGVIGVFGDDNIDSSFGFNSGADWRQPIVKNNIPSMAVVTKTFPSAAASVSHTWTYNSSTVTAVRKFMAVFTPTGASAGGGGGSPSIAISDINTTRTGTMDITANNPDDWALWWNNSLTPTYRRSGGGNLVSNATRIGVGGNLYDYSSYPRTITWSGGTPTASGSSTRGIFTSCGSCAVGQGFELSFPADTTQRSARIYLTYYNASSITVTATLSDGSAPVFTYTGLPTAIGQTNNEASAAFSIDYSAASAGQTMTIRYVIAAGANDADISLNGASVKAGAGGGGSPSGPSMAMGADWGGGVGGYNLTSYGFTDWARWQLNSWTPTNRKAGGGSLISNAAVFGGGSPAYYSDGPLVNFSDGTPSANSSSQEGVYNNSATANRGYSITFPADTTTKIAKIFMGRYNADVRVTASISDASTPDVVINKPLDGDDDGVVTITYSAATAGQTLTVRVQTTTAGGNVALQAAGFDDGTGGLLGPAGPITLVQQSPDVDSSTSAWVTATFPSPVTAGNTIVVPITTWNGEIYTVYDNLGNTYTKVAESLLNDMSRAYIFVANNVYGGTVSINVTSAGGSNKSIAALEFSGLADDTLQLVDQTGAYNRSGGTSATLATTGPTDQADEVAIGVIAANFNRANLNFQTSAPFTATGHVENDGAGEATYSSVYRILSATGTPSHTWTFNPPVDGYDDVVSTMVTLRGQIGQESGGGGGGSGGGTTCDGGVVVTGPPAEGGPGSSGAIAVVQRSPLAGHATWDSQTLNVAFSAPPQAGNSVILMFALTGSTDGPVVHDNQGNRYTQILHNDAGGQTQSMMYIAENIKAPVGTFEVTITKSDAQGNLTAGLMEVAGLEPINARNRVGFTSGSGGTGSTVTANGPTSTANQLVIAAHATGEFGPANVNYGRQGGWSEGFTQNSATTRAGYSSVYRISSSIETPSHAWTYNSIGGGVTYGAGIVTLKGYTTPPVSPTAATVINQTTPSPTNSVSFATSPRAGSTIIVTTLGWANGTPFSVTGVTDNQGNTYTLIGGSNNGGNYNRNGYMYAAYDIAAPSGTFTINVATNPAVLGWRQITTAATEVAGLLPSGLDNVQVIDFEAGVANRTISTSAPTAEANEFAIAFMGGITGGQPGYDVMNDPTWRPIHGNIAQTHSVVTKEFAAAGSPVSHTWNTYGNDVEQTAMIIATFRTDPDFDFDQTPAGPIAPSPNAPRLMSSSGALLDSGSLNVPKPAGTNVGDLLIWVVSIDGAASAPWPYGFTNIDADFIPGPDSHTIGAAWKIADGTEPATFTASSGSYENISFMMRYTGFDAAQPIEASRSKALSGVLPWALTWPANTGSITTTVDNARVVWASVTDHTAIAPDYPVLHVPPEGFTERADLRSGQYSNLGVADKVFRTAGPTGPLNGLATDSWNSAGGGAYSIENGTLAFSIRPGDGGGSSDQPGPIEYVGSDNGRTLLAGARGMQNVNVNAPDNIQAGDLIILAQSTDVEVWNGDSSTITWPAGFTEVNEVSGGSQQFNWAWKIADGSEGLMTVSSSASWALEVVMSVYRGVDPDDPIGAHSGYLEPTDTEFAWPYSVPGITVPNAGSSLVLIPFGDTSFVWGINQGARFFSAPETFVERENRHDNGDAFSPLAVFDRMGVPAGATGNIAGNMINQRMLDPAITGAWAHAGGFLLSLNPDPDPPVAPEPDPLVCTSSILQMCDGSQWRSIATSVSGGIGLDQNASATCDTNATSAIRYNASADRPEYCNGTSWLPFSLGQEGVVLVPQLPVINTFNSFNNGWANGAVTITNVGSRTSGPIGMALSGPDMAMFDYSFYLGVSTCDDTPGLAPGESCMIVVRGRSNTDGPFTAILEVTDPTNTVNVVLRGTATGNTACSPGKLGFGGIIVSCANSTTPEYVLTGSGCGTGTNEPACSNLNSTGIDPQFTMTDTVAWPVQARDIYTNGLQGNLNTINMLSYSSGWNAATYCNNLVKDGYDNWYLPSASEWRSMLGPMAPQLLLDATNPNYWSSTFAFAATTSYDPHMYYYQGSTGETEYAYNGTGPLYTRCLRKHGDVMPTVAPDPFLAAYITDQHYGWYGHIYAPIFKYIYSTSLNTQTVGTAATITGINGMVPVTISGPGTPDFRWRAPAGAWSGYVTTASVGPGYEVQPRAFTPAVAGQEFAINIKVGALNQIWKVRAVQTATRRIFVTSGTYNGNLGGLSGADATCQSVATAAGLGTNWYALLGGNKVKGFDRIPWNWDRLETMNAALVANNMADLEDTVANTNAINRNQSNTATTTTNVWTGMVRRDPYYAGDDGGYEACAPDSTNREWTSSSSSNSGRVGQINNSQNWIDTGTTSACNQLRRLYCVGPF